MDNAARINLTIPQEVHKAARIYAVQHGLTLGQVVTEALRRLLDPEHGKPASP
jgi:predicted HicB family RNase H-like nuclease